MSLNMERRRKSPSEEEALDTLRTAMRQKQHGHLRNSFDVGLK